MNSYTVIEQIGKGGFGDVYKVADDTGHLFAKKVYKDPQIPSIDSNGIRKRFEREVSYQSNIKNSHIVNIIFHDLRKDPPYFIMELAECSLSDELKIDNTLSQKPDNALFDILSGLEAIHSIGITHRDLKPANILKFSDSDGSYRYALSDFGLMTATESETTTITQTNMGGGTPYYAAPECASNLKKATYQSDIYSFGAILHDIYCAGQSRTPYSQLFGHGKIGKVIEKCTKPNGIRRYTSIAELRNALYDAITDTITTYIDSQDQTIISLLSQDQHLTEEEWDQVYYRLSDNEDKTTTNSEIFRYISASHIQYLHDNDASLLNSIGKMYCDHAYSGGFGFNYCDVLAQKLKSFFSYGEIELQAFALLALLALGTSHNRWYVEQIFVSLANRQLSDNLIKRIAIEVAVREMDISKHISHLEKSISFEKINLHPWFIQT